MSSYEPAPDTAPQAKAQTKASPAEPAHGTGARHGGPSSVRVGTVVWGLIVLALRTVEGRAMTDPSDGTQSATALPPRLGSVVVAVPADELPAFASASLTSTMYLALNAAGDGEQASP